jgi:hypothetical protein
MKNAARTAAAEAMWRERVRQWRESGKTMREFVRGQEFAAATLRYWSSRLERSQAPQFVRVVPKTTVTTAAPGLVVEVGSARVRVASDFDPALLAQVVRTLAGDAR